MSDFNQDQEKPKRSSGQRPAVGTERSGRTNGTSRNSASGTRRSSSSQTGRRSSQTGQASRQSRTQGTGRSQSTNRSKSAKERMRQEKLAQERRIRIFGGSAALLLVVLLIIALIVTQNGRKKNDDAPVSLALESTSAAEIETEEMTEDESGDAEEESIKAEAGSDDASENVSHEAGADDPGENTQGESEQEVVYAISTVNVRSIPDTSGEILGKLGPGNAVVRLAEENGWSTVIFNDETGYVSSEFLSTEEPGENTAAPSATGTVASKKIANHQGAWDLSTLDASLVTFGYAEINRDANMIPTDWAWYESKWGSHHVDWIQETSDNNIIYLTMDEGFGNTTTDTILDVLKEKNVKIVFFITENFLNDRPDAVQRMIDEGHIIGNHTCTHPDMTTLSLEEAQEQIMRLHNKVLDQFGYEMTLFRFPEGHFSDQTLGLVDNLGYKSVFWTFGYNDYSQEPEIEYAKEHTVKYFHPGAIYLLHASSETNTAILPYFIDEARARGYEFGVYPVDGDRD